MHRVSDSPSEVTAETKSMQHPDQDCSLGDVVNEDSSPTPRETDSVSTTDIDEAFAGLTVPTPSPSIAMFAATLIPNLAEYTGPRFGNVTL